jgi:hypothetical protein
MGMFLFGQLIMIIDEKGHRTQLNQGVRNLCFPACVASALHMLGRGNYTALQIGRATNTADGTLTDPSEAQAILRHYKIGHKWHTDANWKWYRNLLDEGGQAIALVNYKHFGPFRSPFDPNFEGPHFVYVVAYDETHVTIFDPLREKGSTRIPISRFVLAIETRSGNNNYATQSIRLTDFAKGQDMPNVSGICVDPRHNLGRPNPNLLRGFGWARFAYKVSLGRGNIDLAEPYERYDSYINHLRDVGVTPMLVLTHEFYGEGRYSWGSMNANSWAGLTAGFVALASQVAIHYAGKGLYYQIWNEGDAASEAAVAIPPDIYGTLYKRVRAAIKAADPTAKVICQGLCSGTVTGVNYFKATGIEEHDGIAFHPYLARAAGYGSSPSFADQIRAWSVLKGDLFITEYGQPGNYNAKDHDLAAYATAALTSATKRTKGMFWFAYADGQHTSVGILKQDGLYREELRAALLAEDRLAEAPPALPEGRYKLVHPAHQGSVNIRDKADLSGAIMGFVMSGAIIEVTGSTGFWDGTYLWQAVTAAGVSGHMAVIGGTWELQPYNDDGTQEMIDELDEIIQSAGVMKARLLERAG